MKNIIISVICLLCILVQSPGEETGWKTDVGLSYVATSGNTSTQTFSGNAGTEGTMKTFRYLAKGSYLIAKDDQEEKANKLNINARIEKIITAGLFGFLESIYGQDKYSGYTYRASIGPGLGYDIIRNDSNQLKGLVSSLYYFDKYSVGPVEKKSYATLKSQLIYKWKLSETVNFESQGNYLTSLEDSEKYFMNFETKLNVSMNSRLAIGISYQLNYQNRTPSAEVKKTDTTFMTSLIIHL
ncbi:YdiY family protein [bacterium]